ARRCWRSIGSNGERREVPGAGLEPARPAKGTPDFKSGAYHQFRHPGGLRIAALSGLFARRELEARRNFGRRHADDERDLLVWLEDERRRVAGLLLAVEVPRHPGVPADRVRIEVDGPLREELADREVA